MANYIFANVIGSFVFDSSLKLVAEGAENELKKRFKELKSPDEGQLKRILSFFKQPRFFKRFYEANMRITKKGIKDSVNNDLFVIQSVSSINELDKASNLLVRRLREWYSFYNPEFSGSVQSNERFVELILAKSKKELLKEIRLKEDDSMGADLAENDLKPVKELASQLLSLYSLRKKHEEYLNKLMEGYCPNITAICPAPLAALLLRQAGSLKHLSELPSSTIQLLGAEKALFRHLRNKRNAAPKHGFLHEHPLVQKAANKGRAARVLADKISIAAKVDFFKGNFVGDKLKKDLEKRLK